MDLTLTNTYYAIETWDDDAKCWGKPTDWSVVGKYLKDRVRQLRMSGCEVRVKRINEYREEIIIPFEELGGIE